MNVESGLHSTVSISDLNEDVLFALDGATLRLRDRHVFARTTWSIVRGQHWAVTGPNGSGKSTLARCISGATPVIAGSVVRNGHVSTVSPERYRGVIADDERLDESRYVAGTPHDVARAVDLLPPEVDPTPGGLIDRLGLTHVLPRPLRSLSTGEIRKLLLADALSRVADIYVLDEPYDGLDASARVALSEAIENLLTKDVSVILVSHRNEEIPSGILNQLIVNNCSVIENGDRPAHADSREGRNQSTSALPHRSNHDRIHTKHPHRDDHGAPFAEPTAEAKSEPTLEPTAGQTMEPTATPTIEFRSVTVKYEETTVVKDLTWAMHPGENWCIHGPNGSGKTTIFDLIYGTHQQAYANHVRVFGRQRGEGESIWQLRRNLGIVTPHLQSRYERRLDVLEVILSGFYDSIGLFRRPTNEQIETARRTAEELGITELVGRDFSRLSTGERMLVLIARALVKRPRLLMLDEPCQGLDHSNRNLVTEAASIAGLRPDTDLLYITHHADEIPHSITHVLELPAPTGDPSRIKRYRTLH